VALAVASMSTEKLVVLVLLFFVTLPYTQSQQVQV
jgi:hypothetical protein